MAELDDRALSRLCKALSHPARIAILRVLAVRGQSCCGEIVRGLPLAQSTVSQHLKIMCEAGLLCSEAHGARCSYGIDPAALGRLKMALAALDAIEVVASCSKP